jgi:Na+:H+ antiporter, NhaA family
VVGLSALAGIGFTVSLFVTELAFTQEAFADVAKIGIFAGSAVAGVVGSAILLRARAVGSAQDEELLGSDS